MKSVAVRDLRQRWPEVEKALEREGELFITRDGERVARLVRFAPRPRRRGRFDPDEHARWMRRTFGRRVLNLSAALIEDREDD